MVSWFVIISYVCALHIFHWIYIPHTHTHKAAKLIVEFVVIERKSERRTAQEQQQQQNPAKCMRNMNGVDSEKCASHWYAICIHTYMYIALLSRLGLVQAILLDSLRSFFLLCRLNLKPFSLNPFLLLTTYSHCILTALRIYTDLFFFGRSRHFAIYKYLQITFPFQVSTHWVTIVHAAWTRAKVKCIVRECERDRNRSCVNLDAFARELHICANYSVCKIKNQGKMYEMFDRIFVWVCVHSRISVWLDTVVLLHHCARVVNDDNRKKRTRKYWVLRCLN